MPRTNLPHLRDDPGQRRRRSAVGAIFPELTYLRYHPIVPRGLPRAEGPIQNRFYSPPLTAPLRRFLHGNHLDRALQLQEDVLFFLGGVRSACSRARETGWGDGPQLDRITKEETYMYHTKLTGVPRGVGSEYHLPIRTIRTRRHSAGDERQVGTNRRRPLHRR